MKAEHIKFFLDGYNYEWHGGFGCILKSVEKNVKKGDVRIIANILFYASYAYPGREVSWTIQDKDLSVSKIQEFKRSILL